MAPYLSGIYGHIGVSDRFYVKLKSADDAVLLEEFAELIRVRSGTSPCGRKAENPWLCFPLHRGMILSLCLCSYWNFTVLELSKAACMVSSIGM